MKKIKVPEGYMLDSQNRLIPEDQVREIDKARDDLIHKILVNAKIQSESLARFKNATMKDIETFIARSAKKFKVTMGGKKGNVTLITFDGKFKIVRSITEFLTFDERLQVAKELVDECIQKWSDGSRDEIKVLVTDAFNVNKQGKIDRNRILGLRKLNIKDPKWKKAMDAITESITIANTKEYIRIYERDEKGSYIPITLDIANI